MIKELIHLKQLIIETTELQPKVQAYCDNQAAIAIATNPCDHSRTKHIDVKFHFIRSALKDHIIELDYVPTSDNIADIFTKALARPTFERLRSKLNVCTSIPSVGGSVL